MAKNTAHQRRYKVTLKIEGEVQRVVTASSEDEAIAITKKMLLEADRQTPQKNALSAFCWDIDRGYASLHWDDLLPNEREELLARYSKNESENTEGEKS